MPLSLNPVVTITVQQSSLAPSGSNFDVGLLLTNSETIPVDERARVYNGLEALAEDFPPSTDVYRSAEVYFMQETKPTRIAVGRIDDGESILEAVTACRDANSLWYAVLPTDATVSDIAAVDAYIAKHVRPTIQLATVAHGVDRSAITSKRTLVQVAKESDDVVLPEKAISIGGWALGANQEWAKFEVGRSQAGAYTLNSKTVAGVVADSFTEVQVQAIKQTNGNVYVNRGSKYDLFEPGVMADGSWFDQVVNKGT